MSQSQFSDAYSSSLYDSEIVDNPTCLLSTDQQIFTPEPSGSQQTFDSFDPEFLRPLPPLTVPACLIRVGPDRRKGFVQYTDMTSDDFVRWWLQTDCGRKRRIRWDSKHQSEAWNSFEQVASGTDGAPKIMCKRCAQILEHPQTICERTGTRHGTSTMSKHLKGAGCRKAIGKQAQKQDIKRFMQDTVCFSFLFYFL